MPMWLHLLAIAMLAAGGMCAIAIALDEIRHPQHMMVMNAVWPLCALFGTVFVAAAYLAFGRPHGNSKHADGEYDDGGRKHPFAVSVGIGTGHCGSGCALGDIVAEWLAYLVPAIAVAFGYRWFFTEKMFAVWILDYIVAFIFGIAFQYYSIVPMKKLSPREGLIAALKADTLSLTAWQIGMYGFMAFAQFYLFRHLLGARLEVASVEFWFMMQLAMLVGFITSYPANWWLIRSGIKEAM